MNNHQVFRSYSGDLFYIPNEQFIEEVEKYTSAIKANDDATMLYFEEGWTGWKYVEQSSSKELNNGY